MTFNELCIVLEKIGVDTSFIYPRSPTQVQVPCPLAEWMHDKRTDHHASMSIRFGKPPTVFKCFSCNEAGTISQLIGSYASLANRSDLQALSVELLESDRLSLKSCLEELDTNLQDWMFIQDRKVEYSIDLSIVEGLIDVYDATQSKEYLTKNRKPPISQKLAKEFNLKYDFAKRRVVFPVVNIDNRIVGAVGRTVCDEEPKYKNYYGFRATDHLGGIDKLWGGKRILIVEGYFDLLNAFKYRKKFNYDVLCTWKAQVSEEHAKQLLKLDKPIWCGFDDDDAGELGWIEAQKNLKAAFGLRRLKPIERKDIGAMNEYEFVQSIALLESRIFY